MIDYKTYVTKYNYIISGLIISSLVILCLKINDKYLNKHVDDSESEESDCNILINNKKDIKPLPVISNQKTNDHLKDIGKELKFNDPVAKRIFKRGKVEIEYASGCLETVRVRSIGWGCRARPERN